MNLTKIFRKVEVTEELGKQTSETKKFWNLTFKFLDFVLQFFSFPLSVYFSFFDMYRWLYVPIIC